MVRTAYEHLLLVDTSAVLALFDSNDRFHAEATTFVTGSAEVWCVVNVTSHEIFTRIRYDFDLAQALAQYDSVRRPDVRLLAFDADDEATARRLLEKYADQTLSYHDAICAAVMLRIGIYKVFSFDSDFWVFGFEVKPGITR